MWMLPALVKNNRASEGESDRKGTGQQVIVRRQQKHIVGAHPGNAFIDSSDETLIRQRLLMPFRSMFTNVPSQLARFTGCSAEGLSFLWRRIFCARRRRIRRATFRYSRYGGRYVLQSSTDRQRD
jgi:hypothetical protein